MHPRIVYIHGVGRQAEPAALELEWDRALFGRDMGPTTRMAYWADVLHGTDYSELRGLAQPAGGRLDVEAVLRAARLESPAAVDYARRIVRTLDRRPPANGRIERVLPLPGFLRRPIARLFLEAFIADTASYFFRPGIRKRIQQRLRRALPPPGRPFVLVAHSQGTIIALEVLAKIESLRVRPFVTIGSPLGIAEIQDLLSCPRVVPASIERWVNFAHRLDPVALDRGLGNDFAPRGAIDDETIVARRRDGRGHFNPHSAIGYLSHPKVRAVVQASGGLVTRVSTGRKPAIGL